MKRSLANRLAALYATLLGVTIILVILASSVALVTELANFTFAREVLFEKHEEAREIAAREHQAGRTIVQAAPDIVNALTGLGLRVAVYDTKGRFLAGDKSVHPDLLYRVVSGQTKLPEPPPAPRPGSVLEFPPPPNGAVHPSPGSSTGPPLFRREMLFVTAVTGGYVAFDPSSALLLVALVPYWKIVVVIAIVAILLSWFVGRLFARQALAPVTEVAESLRALADGDYTPRRFVTAGGDEIGGLTAAYNDAVVGVSSAMEERRQTEERMRQFVADAGHELRTPLTVIGGYIDVLRRGAIEEPKIARQILGTMSLEKEHMRSLIDRLMRLARLDEEQAPRNEPIDVSELLRSQVEAARRFDDARMIDYSVEGPLEVIADRGELGEALWNVVENALKYAPEAPVHLSAQRFNGSTKITVRDEGPGMSESERLHAFERFYRGDQRGEISGTGLGLAIAKRAVERSGGSIALESAPGRGTTVTITVPSQA